MLAEAGTPATCEADVLGAVTAVALEAASGRRAFVADLVDAATDGTVAFWHCGQAAPDLAHPDEPVASTVHPNRRRPLLHEFRLRPGRITIARLGHTTEGLRLAVGGGEILDAPRPFAGTSRGRAARHAGGGAGGDGARRGARPTTTASSTVTSAACWSRSPSGSASPVVAL